MIDRNSRAEHQNVAIGDMRKNLFFFKMQTSLCRKPFDCVSDVVILNVIIEKDGLCVFLEKKFCGGDSRSGNPRHKK